MVRVQLMTAERAHDHLEAECLYLERQVAVCPEALRAPFQALAAERRAAMDALRTEIDAVQVAVPNEATRFIPPDAVIAEDDNTVAPGREG